MNNKITLEERIKQYGESADAISCLTEEDHFKGSTEYLKQIRQMTDLPIMNFRRWNCICKPCGEAGYAGSEVLLWLIQIMGN